MIYRHSMLTMKTKEIISLEFICLHQNKQSNPAVVADIFQCYRLFSHTREKVGIFWVEMFADFME